MIEGMGGGQVVLSARLIGSGILDPLPTAKQKKKKKMSILSKGL